MKLTNSRKSLFAAVLATGALTAGLAAGPASAQQQNGLVNLAVTDVNVQLPIALAANVCDVNVGVLAELERAGGATCNATADSMATGGKGARDGTAGSDTQQDGLVNVFISDVNVQVPIAIAANVCDLNVGVLAQMTRFGGANCDADADADATR